jgi:hypothetical protein
MLRFLIAAAALALGVPALAQTTFSPTTQQVQLLAPQLIPFSGSTGNFDSLVVGLTTAAPVTLATVGTDGSLQIVTFTPGTVVSATDAARLLEAARQNLIARGIAAPTGQQIAAALMGGNVAAPAGTSAINGVLTGTATSPTPVTVRTDTSVLQGSAPGSNLSTAQLQAVRNALSTGVGVTLATTGAGGTPQNVTFAPFGSRLTDFEVNQALQLAGTLLAQQGVLNPTADQLRVALFGGTLPGLNGGSVLLQGVLQGQLRNTSDSSGVTTSASPTTSTSASPTTSTSASPVISTSTSPAISASASPAISASASPAISASASPVFSTSAAQPVFGGTASAGGGGLVPRGATGSTRIGAR